MRLLTLSLLFLGASLTCFAQKEEDIALKEKALATSKNYTWEGNKNLSENKFVVAEVDYRKAIASSAENAAAPYNLGNAYYQNETFSEAFGRFKEAGEKATEKSEKHMAYHNMGNVFMKRKDYAKAVEAYKEALRNNPKDEETRYNLALAKELLKKDEENKDQNKDQEDNQDNKDNKEQNQDQKNEGDNKDKNDQNQDQKDQGDEGEENEQQKDESKEGDGDEKKEQNKKPEDGNENEQQQPRPNQLSKQQVENLLRAMQNAEKQVQEKVDAKKVKGAKVKNEKDW